MKNEKWLFVLMVVLVLFVTVGCGGAKKEYTLECNIDTEQYGFVITGEDGQISVQTQGETTRSNYDTNGNIESVSVEVNRTLTFEESGNVYTIVGDIDLDIKRDTVTYDITATGDTFEEPQTCQK